MANGITDNGTRIKPMLAYAVTPDAYGFYNGTRVIPVAEYDFTTGLPLSAGVGTAGGFTTDGRRIQAAALTEVTPDAAGFYNGTRVKLVQKFDWNTGDLANDALPGAGQSSIPDGLQSWWMTDAADVNGTVLTLGYSTSTPSQGIAEVDTTTGLTIETKDLLTDVWQKDDHNQTPFKRLQFSSPAGVLYSMMTGHGVSVASPGTDDHTFYECWSTTGRIADFNTPRTITNTIGRSNLIQLFEQTNGAIWAYTCDDLMPQRWLFLHKTSYDATATQLRGCFTQTSAPGGGQNQMYSLARSPSADTLRMFSLAHASNLENPLHCCELDLATKVLTDGSGTLQDLDTSVGALPELADISTIYTPATGKSIRLLAASDAADAVLLSVWDAATDLNHELWILVWDGVGSVFSSGSWDAHKICDVGPFVWEDSNYSYGASFGRESHAADFRVYYARRVGSDRYLCRGDTFDMGATWNETIIETTTAGSYFRPNCPVGATDDFAVVRGLYTAYIDYLIWTASITWKGNSALNPLSITTTSILNPTEDVAYAQTLASTGGTQPVHDWQVTAGSLPAGLSLNSTTGEISGTPTTAGPFSFTVTATDDEGRTDDQPYSGTVQAASNFPTLIGMTTGGSPSANATTHSIDLPGSIPTGAYIQLNFGCDGVPTVTSPAGFTNFTDNTNLASSKQRECWKLADGTEGGTTVSFTTSASEKSQIVATVWTPYDSAQAPQKQGNQNASIQNPDPSTITPVWGAANNTYVTFIVIDGAVTLNSGGTNGGYPSGFTPIVELTGASDGVGIAMAYKQDGVSTSVDPPAWATTAATGIYRNTIAIKGV